jgi:light-regulated signal transduction histidine kinase (bacteriophytochrome)
MASHAAGVRDKPEWDLVSCDREPIHLSGAIQPHGLLFAASPGDLRITAVSENVGAYCGCAAGDLLDRSLGTVLSPAAFRAVANADKLAAGEVLNISRLARPA